MARLFVRASSERVDLGSAPVAALPLTLAAWGRSSDATVAQTVLSLTDGGAAGADNSWIMNFQGNIAGDPVRAVSVTAGTTVAAATTTGYSGNTWHHLCAVFASSTSRTAYIDGGSAGSETTSNTPTGVDQGAIGALKHATPTNYMAGDICEAAIWSVALSASQVLMLARGHSPLFVAPMSLVFYAPLIRTSQDVRSGVALTETGGAVSAHFRQIHRAPPFYNEYAVAAAAVKRDDLMLLGVGR